MPGEAINPYAPPKSDWVHAPNPASLGPRQWWLEGDRLVVLRGGSLPADLCVKTGQPTQLPPKEQTLQWIHPAFAIAIISPIIFLILYLIFRKTAKMTYAVSPEFVKNRRLAGAIILGTVGLFVLGVVIDSAVVLVVSLLAFLVGLIVALRMMTPFQIRKIDKERIYLKIDDRFRQALAARG
jgi:hypothetical protein